MTNNLGLALSSFQADVAANRPTKFPGNYNFAIYLATDTGEASIAPNPGPPATFGGDNPNAVWAVLGGSLAPVFVPDAATYTVLTANSGKRHIMPNLTADDTITLPAPTLGLNFEFVYGGVASDAQSWIFKTPSATNFFTGGLLHADTNAGSAGDELAPVNPNGSTNAKLTVAVPGAGTRIRFTADGTHWIIDGIDAADTAPVFADLP